MVTFCQRALVLYALTVIIVQCEFSYRDFLQTQCPSGYILDSSQTSSWLCYNGPQSLLQYIIFPVSVDDFASNYFDKRPLHIPRQSQPSYYAPLHISNAFEGIVSQLDTRSDIIGKDGVGFFPDLFIAKYNTGQDMHVKPWRGDQTQQYLDILSPNQRQQIEEYHELLQHDLGPWDNAAVGYMHQHNYTLKWNRLEYHIPSLRTLSQALAQQTGFAVRSNLYYTPAFSKGFNAHYDVEDAWVIQLNNTKHWKVYRDLNSFCGRDGFAFRDQSDLCQANIVTELSTQGYDAIRDTFLSDRVVREEEDVVLDVELKEGDFLYIPRGWLHEADSLHNDKHSVHVTLGVYLEMYADYLHQMTRYLFTVKDAKPVFKSVFYAKQVSADQSDDVKVIRKNLLSVFEAWLRTLAFKRPELRQSVGLFHHVEIGDEFMDEIIKLFGVYFPLFIRYVETQAGSLAGLGLYGSETYTYAERFAELLDIDRVRRKLKQKLRKHYSSVFETDPVYRPDLRATRSRLKKITYMMRFADLRKELNFLV